jgi:hypothetical protein
MVFGLIFTAKRLEISGFSLPKGRLEAPRCAPKRVSTGVRWDEYGLPILFTLLLLLACWHCIRFRTKRLQDAQVIAAEALPDIPAAN